MCLQCPHYQLTVPVVPFGTVERRLLFKVLDLLVGQALAVGQADFHRVTSRQRGSCQSRHRMRQPSSLTRHWTRSLF